MKNKIPSFIIFAFFASSAHAEPINAYYQDAKFACGNQDYTAEWSIVGDTSTSVTFTRFTRRLDNNRFEDLTWEVTAENLDGIIALNDRNDRPHSQIEGLFDGTPVSTRLNSAGAPRGDCNQVLSPIATPSERYDEVITFLGTALPTADDAITAPVLIAGLPPSDMLPTLAQENTRDTLDESQKEFWTRYEASARTLPADPSDRSHLASLETVWLAADSRQLADLHFDILHDVQTRQANALAAAAGDVALLIPDDTNRLCARLDGVPNRRTWSEYLEVGTGLPLRYWTQERAETLLQATNTCEEAAIFSERVANRWPAIEKLLSGYEVLTAERDRLWQVEVNLTTAATESWFQLPRDLVRDMRDYGLSQDTVSAELGAILDQKQSELIQILPSEIEASFEAANLDLSEYRRFCSNFERQNPLPFRSEAATVAKEHCTQFVAEQFELASSNILNEERDRLENIDVSLESASMENWFILDRDFTREMSRLGISGERVQTALEPILEEKTNDVFDILPSAIETAATDAQLGLDDYASFCANFERTQGFPRQSEIRQRALAVCEPFAARLFQTAAIAEVERIQADLLNREGTLQDINETNGYHVESLLPRFTLNRSEAFVAAMSAVEDAQVQAQNAVEGAYQAALDKGLEDIQTTFATAQPLTDSEDVAMNLCQGTEYAFTNSRIAPLANLCRESVAALQQQRDVAECDNVWAGFDVPGEVQDIRLDIPQLFGGTERTRLRDVLCQADQEGVDLSVEEGGGWFSTSYRLVRQTQFDGQPLVFSIRLSEPDTGSVWQIDDPEMSPQNLDAEKLTTSQDYMACLYFTEDCVAR